MRSNTLLLIAVTCLIFIVHKSVADGTANKQNIVPVVSLLLKDTKISCDDGNVCTDDTFDPSIGCVHTNNTAPCDDGDVCTTSDTCDSGSCVGGSPLNCDDGNVCTDDSCNAATGCVSTNNTAPCDDELFCNGFDTCQDGVCSMHAGDPCPGADGDIDCAESCDEASDDCTAPDPNGSGCDDGDPETTDTCEDGVCIGLG